MVGKKQMQWMAMVAAFGIGSSYLGGIPAADAAEMMSVSMSRLLTCEAQDATPELGDLQISENESFLNAVSSTGDTLEITLPEGVSFRQDAYKKAGWGSSSTVYQGMKLFFSGKQVVNVTLFGDAKGVKKDAYVLPLYVSMSLPANTAQVDELCLELNGLDSAIPSQSLKFARISDKGVTYECMQPVVMGRQESGSFTFRLTEKTVDSLNLQTDTLQLTLPNAFVVQQGTINGLGGFTGSQSIVKSQISGNKINLALKNYGMLGRTGNNRGILELTVKVSTTAEACLGEAELAISGSGNVEAATLSIGTIGEFTLNSSVKSPTEVIAGQVGQKLGTIVIEEDVPGSFVAGSTIKLTLPEGVKFADDYTAKQIQVTKGNMQLHMTSSDASGFAFVIDTATTKEQNCIEIPLDKMNLRPGLTGDIQVELEGKGGLSGNVTVGKAILPVHVTVDEIQTLTKGNQGQKLGTITIQENQTGALEANQEVVLQFPEGIQLEKGAELDITSGNLEVGNLKTVEVGNDASRAELRFTVASASSAKKPATIVIRNIQVTVSRLMESGSVKMEVQGSAVANSYEGYWQGDAAVWSYKDYPSDKFSTAELFRTQGIDHLFDVAAADTVVVANCQSDGNYSPNESRFTIGSLMSIIQGESQMIPAAPYIKDGRTMLPVRYVAYACGVTPEDVVWDAAAQRITLKKGNREVQLVIGGRSMMVGDTVQTMDVAPEITDGYTFLPARFVAEAFHCEVGWDAESQSVTVRK